MNLTRAQVRRLSLGFEKSTPREILEWTFGKFWSQIAMSSSFQTQSMPLLHMVRNVLRDQTTERAQAQILELQENGRLKGNPLLNWTKTDVQEYCRLHHLPDHPSLERGYRSIGCAPCTVAIGANDDERSGRWAGRGKTECGLHTKMFQQKDLARMPGAFQLSIPAGHEQKE